MHTYVHMHTHIHIHIHLHTYSYGLIHVVRPSMVVVSLDATRALCCHTAPEPPRARRLPPPQKKNSILQPPSQPESDLVLSRQLASRTNYLFLLQSLARVQSRGHKCGKRQITWSGHPQAPHEPVAKQGGLPVPPCRRLAVIYRWAVVKITVPLWVPNIVRHLIFRVPKKGP